MPDRTARLRRLVAVVVALGLATQAAVAWAVHDTGPVVVLGGSFAWASGPALLVALLVLSVVGELVAVRVRHGEETEELTLFEVAVVVGVLLLPGLQALLVPVAASAVGSLVRRREPVKALFNAGNLAAATAVQVAVVHLVSGAGAGLTAPTVAALLVGSLLFAAVNLLALAAVLAVVAGLTVRQVVADGVRLSVLAAVGTVALGGTLVTAAEHAPALLPFTVVPAAALTFAYRAAAQEAEERERSGRLLALSQVLAGRLDGDALLDSFLELSRQAFGADSALAVLDGPVAWADDGEGRRVRRTPSDLEQVLLLRSATSGACVVREGLPQGWTHALLAPLEADGRRVGVVVLGSRERPTRLGTRELTVLTPLASALAVALRGAAHVRRLTEETSKLQAVVDQSSDGILVVDGDGRVLLWSPAVAALTGRDELSALGRPVWTLLAASRDGEPVDAFSDAVAQLAPGTPHTSVELVLTRHDGEQRVVRCAHAAAFDDAGALVRDVVILHDVTRERQVERLKADFIATVSHELRTPVTPIKGYADLLRKRGHEMTQAKREECLAVIADRADHLATLVEDLLLASRISATSGAGPEVDLQPADLAELVRRACADFDAEGTRVALHVPDALPVRCDRVRTVQVLGNLVANALKYSGPGTPVEVRATVADGVATVEVADVGRGIPADQLEKVFDKFHRVEDPMRMTTGGTGLGLYIARTLATAMGGTLTCTSVLGRGSTFRFALPATVPLPRAAEALCAAPEGRVPSVEHAGR